MPDEVGYEQTGGEYLIPAGVVSKTLPGLQEAKIAAQVLALIKALPAKTPGVAEIKAGAISLAHAAGEKLSKAK